MSEVYETKKGILIIECDCGIVHKIKHIDETDELEISSKLDKSKVKPETKEPEIEESKKESKENAKNEKSRYSFFRK